MHSHQSHRDAALFSRTNRVASLARNALRHGTIMCASNSSLSQMSILFLSSDHIELSALSLAHCQAETRQPRLARFAIGPFLSLAVCSMPLVVRADKPQKGISKSRTPPCIAIVHTHVPRLQHAACNAPRPRWMVRCASINCESCRKCMQAQLSTLPHLRTPL